MSFSLSGAFWLTILPLFHGPRCAATWVCSMTNSVRLCDFGAYDVPKSELHYTLAVR